MRNWQKCREMSLCNTGPVTVLYCGVGIAINNISSGSA